MVWKFVGIVVILLIGIFGISFLEDFLIGAPRRRMLEKKARERMAAKNAEAE